MEDLKAKDGLRERQLSKHFKMLHSRKENALSCLREVVHIVYSVTVRSRAANGIFDWHDTGTNMAQVIGTRRMEIWINRIALVSGSLRRLY